MANIEIEQTAWTLKVANVFLCKKNISALVGDAGVGRVHIEALHQGGGDTGHNVSPAKLVALVFYLSKMCFASFIQGDLQQPGGADSKGETF